jgi:purine nucleosidase
MMRGDRMMSTIRLCLARLGLTLTVSAGLLAATLTIPVERWRTGELPVTPLSLESGGPKVTMSRRIWVDTDAACGTGRRNDSDDCLALLMLAGAPEVKIAGVSSVSGNAAAGVTEETARQLVARMAKERSGALHVYRGGGRHREEPDSAVAGLQRALASGPLTIVALGPLTNIAEALEGRPDLQKNVTRLVAVMGRRRGHVFHPSEGNGRGVPFGHGPIFTDFNVNQHPEAARRVFAMQLPTTLIPYEAARSIEIRPRDLDRLEASGGAAAWVARRSRGWLEYWRDVIGTSGFYPFDLVAAAYVVEPRRFACAELDTWVTPARSFLWRWYSPLSVEVGTPVERPEQALTQSTSIYCPKVDPDVHRIMLRRLAGGAA